MSADRKVDRAHVWQIIAVVVTIVGLVITVAIAVATFNMRYDASCSAADSFQITYNSTKNTGASTLTASAGSVMYGAWQYSGTSCTTYDFYYKKSSNATYSHVRTVTFLGNGTNYRQGEWRLARSYSTQKYDVKIARTSNKTTNSVIRVDWAVDDY